MPHDREISSESSDSETHPVEGLNNAEPNWNWEDCLPSLGTVKYVRALQLLGLELAAAVPEKVRQQAITALPEPTGDLIVGSFGKKPTRERLLTFGSTLISVS